MAEKAYALVFSPHPDDAEIGAGGTLIRWGDEGKRVVLVTCTNGDKGTNDPNITQEDLVKIRIQEQQKSAEIMGIAETVRLTYSDQTLEDSPAFREDVTRLIRIYQPDVVLTTDFQRRYRSHPDHCVTGRVVMDAVSLYSRNLYAFPDMFFKENLDMHMVKEVFFWGTDNPNCCFDITSTWDRKTAARNCHVSQFGDPSGERDERMKEMYRMHAEEEEFELGEAFHRIDMEQPPARRSRKKDEEK